MTIFSFIRQVHRPTGCDQHVASCDKGTPIGAIAPMGVPTIPVKLGHEIVQQSYSQEEGLAPHKQLSNLGGKPLKALACLDGVVRKVGIYHITGEVMLFQKRKVYFSTIFFISHIQCDKAK